MTTNGIAGTRTTQDTTSSRGIGAMKSEDFFKIMVSEMQNQDPLEPNKTSDMISEVSQVRSIELQSKLGDSLDTLVKQQRVSEASSMIGKFVTASADVGDGANTTVGGRVVALHYADDGSANLELDTGDVVPLDQVQLVTTVEEAAAAINGGGSGGNATAKSLNAKAAEPQNPFRQMWQGFGRMLHLS